MRDDIDTHYHRWMNENKQMNKDVVVKLCIPRLCGRKQRCDNVPAGTPDEYYQRNLTIPLMDHVLMEMKSSFLIPQQSATYRLCFVPATMVFMKQAEILQKLSV